ncbi:hypothetical protein Cni_G14619 [Canna indica]|uniref:Uncharacterized protein n=1 Tax=Canna indica TaxID=4628 RepID=A0AAQ3KFF4_9LILI|nr:hypothetical protein Cni_G14619 [Canna indica]
MERGDEVVDVHDGVQFTCRLVSRSISGPSIAGLPPEPGLLPLGGAAGNKIKAKQNPHIAN